MALPSLPDDPGEWPQDPLALFSLDRGFSERDLRRAYAQRVREYKPERQPEAFRVIREAYEYLQQMLLWQGSQPSASPAWQVAPETEPLVTWSVKRPAKHTADASDEPQMSHAPDREPKVDPWALVEQARYDEALRKLEELVARAPHDVQLARQMYWLLTIMPGGEVERRRDWLATRLAQDAPDRFLDELYRRELESWPKEVLSERYQRLLDGTLEVWRVFAIVSTAWRATSHYRDAARLIARDLERLRPWLPAQDEATWMSLLLTACVHLVWTDEGTFNRYRKEIEEAVHLHHRFTSEMDAFEAFLDAADALTKLVAQHPHFAAWLNLLRAGRTQPPASLRHFVLGQLHLMLEEPRATLAQLDALEKQGPTIVTELIGLIEPLVSEYASDAEPEDLEAVRDATLRFLEAEPWFEPQRCRQRLLEFCFQAAVLPSEMADAIGYDERYWITNTLHLRESLAEDRALELIAMAQRIMTT